MSSNRGKPVAGTVILPHPYIGTPGSEDLSLTIVELFEPAGVTEVEPDMIPEAEKPQNIVLHVRQTTALLRELRDQI